MGEERYRLAPLGCIETALRGIVPNAPEIALAVVDALELHMRRHHEKPDACAAIILDAGKLTFGSVQSADAE